MRFQKQNKYVVFWLSAAQIQYIWMLKSLYNIYVLYCLLNLFLSLDTKWLLSQTILFCVFIYMRFCVFFVFCSIFYFIVCDVYVYVVCTIVTFSICHWQSVYIYHIEFRQMTKPNKKLRGESIYLNKDICWNRKRKMSLNGPKTGKKKNKIKWKGNWQTIFG